MTDLRKVQLKQLSILKEVAKLCEKHHIRYYALGGTLLGAVRHQGFIPWDDDLDIGMPRPDYEKFLKIAGNKIGNYSIHTCYNDEKFIYPYIRIQDPSVILRRDNTKNKTLQELWVDVFPLDGAPSSKLQTFLWQKKLTVLRGLRNLSCFDELVNVNKEYHGVKKIIFAIGNHSNIQKLLNTNKILKSIDKSLQQYPYETSDMIGNTMGGHWFDEVYPKNTYSETVMLPFEDTTVPAPADYHTIMKLMYGDYMKLPDEKDRNWHGTTIYKI